MALQYENAKIHSCVRSEIENARSRNLYDVAHKLTQSPHRRDFFNLQERKANDQKR